MIAILLTLFISYLATNLFGYVVHWSLHQEWVGRHHEAHMTHHLRLYPPEDFTSLAYRSAGKDSTVWFFAAASIPMILVPILLGYFGVISIVCMVAALIMEGTLGFLHNYIHDAMHIKPHWMRSLPFFDRLSKLHMLHHIDMNTNYGIFTFHWDRLFRTFWEDK